MTAKIEGSVDETGMKIIRELQTNARSSFSEIGRRVGLSSPAVAERVYKMEEAGIISGYHAEVNAEIFNHSITAFITVTTQSARYPEIFSFAEEQKGILECHHISGNESLILKVATKSIAQLDRMIERLGKFGETRTAIVLSTPIRKKMLEPI